MNKVLFTELWVLGMSVSALLLIALYFIELLLSIKEFFISVTGILLIMGGPFIIGLITDRIIEYLMEHH